MSSKSSVSSDFPSDEEFFQEVVQLNSHKAIIPKAIRESDFKSMLKEEISDGNFDERIRNVVW